MRVIKNIVSQLHTFVLWALVSVLLWGWIYTFIGDTAPEHKVTVFVEAYALESEALSLRLEEHLPEGIKMIKAHDFDYQLFSTGSTGDIYIVRASVLRTMLEEDPGKVLPVQAPEGETAYLYQGQCCGIRIFDASTQTGRGMQYIQYTPLPDPEPEDYYLVFSSETQHLNGAAGALDNAAWDVAMELLSLE